MNVKCYVKSLVLLVLLILFLYKAESQTYRGNSEYSVSYGLFSIQEMANQTLLGSDDAGTDVTNTTGNIFVTYRYFLSPRLAIGGAIGTVSFKAHSWSDVGNSTDFDYRYTTIAPELLFNFVDRKWVRAYTYLGAGYSFVEGNTTDYYNSQPAPTQIISRGTFNAHYVPIGLSVGDGLSAFFEVGIGYKGIFHGGLSLKLGKKKPYAYEQVTVNKGDVFLLPRNYPVDSSFKDLGKVKTIMLPHGDVYDYHNHKEQAMARTKSRNGNVFIADKIIEARPNHYTHIKGRAFYVHDTAGLRMKIRSNKTNLNGRQFTNLVIYCMDNRPSHGYSIKINDGARQVLHTRSKYVFRVDREGSYKLSYNKRNYIFVDVKFGDDCYVKYYLSEEKKHKTRMPTVRFKIMNTTRGELESATMKHNFFVDLESTKQ